MQKIFINKLLKKNIYKIKKLQYTISLNRSTSFIISVFAEIKITADDHVIYYERNFTHRA